MENFKKYDELTEEEMRNLQGTEDVQAETTPVCAFTAASSIVCADVVTVTISFATCR
ncbi:type 2 lantibiotic, SP_1948 family [Gemella morbillorum]|jgi:type 2 lantibiotic (TIGR03893 family)|uniref:lichenicidin A2 family type 2 lantibiotic n=1 Tax=Gemella morbillorum TaxID=29391 RepID=UPI000DA3A0C6|nr:lichenicidin A2 family type 2 lantibiotic [Gemella morbillorum]UBH80449.1 lichenicidin A2 family type 2 lantibiotic [Gemella morbillorum]SQH55844.1 type 2 lantibiotic, SP_1948 family [Gemella morbillorum]DAT98859.1 MAG TPA: Two-component Enterococcus faecalis cytolysin (EFC) [Caudoviricetes sp.]